MRRPATGAGGRPTSRAARTALLCVALLVAALLGAAPASAGGQDAPSVVRVADRVLDPSARGNVTYGATANVGSYQQDGLLTYGRFQYTAWYAADRSVVLARRPLGATAWDSVVLDAVLHFDDSHNNVTLGVSPGDGRLHVALATHADRIRYLRSVPGLADGAAAWSSRSFEPLAGTLPGAPGAPRSWTYPSFELAGSTLLLTWRDGTALGGGQALARYDGGPGGAWSYLGTFTGGTGAWSSPYGTSTSRYAYLHGFTRNRVTGDLEVTWTWRESAAAQHPSCPGAPANRDLGYARSPDGGVTWLNDAGAVIARTGTDDVITTEDEQVVARIPVQVGMINQEAQAVDSAGRVHVVTSEVDEETLAEVGGCLGGDYYEQRGELAQPVHRWRGTDGTWHATTLPFRMGNGGRSSLVLDASDTAYLVLPDGRVVAATAAGGWSDWTLVFDAADVDSVSETVVDHDRALVDGVLSVMYQERGSVPHAPSAFRVADFALGGGGAHAGKDPAPVAAPRPYEGSATVWPRATSTSRHGNFPPQLAVDGDPGSSWLSGRDVVGERDGIPWVTRFDSDRSTGGAASATAPQTLTVEWGGQRWVDSVTLDPGGVRGPRDYVLRGRVGGAWRTVATVAGHPRSQTATYPVPAVRLDALRVVVTRGYGPQAVQVAEVSTAGTAPGGRFVWGTLARAPRAGSATLGVRVPGTGVLRLRRGPGVQAARVAVAQAGTSGLSVRPRGAAAAALSVRRCRAAGGRVSRTVRVTVDFTPAGGRPVARTRTVRLVRTC